MINNRKLTQPIGTTKDNDLPGMYSDSKLFARKHPNAEGSQYSEKALDEMSDTKKATDLLDQMNLILKAGMSAGRYTMPSEPQAKRESENSYARYSEGISGGQTPDLPERGRDWHGTVPGVPDEPQDDQESEQYFDEAPKNLLAPTQEIQQQTSKQPPPQMQQQPAPQPANQQAMKALSGAPLFSPGPMMAPREADFLTRQGFSPEEINSGLVQMTPNMRMQYNSELQSAVQKSIASFWGKVGK